MSEYKDKKQQSAHLSVQPTSIHNKSVATGTYLVDNRLKAIAQKAMREKFEAAERTAGLQEVQQATVQKKSNNTGLPDNLKKGVENLSGFSMDDVKVHYNSGKPAHLQALAYAQGTDIHVGPGQEKYLPHEAWHIIQQKQGRVQSTMQMKEGVGVNDDTGLEKEADIMGGKANDAISNKDAEIHKENTEQTEPLIMSTGKTKKHVLSDVQSLQLKLLRQPSAYSGSVVQKASKSTKSNSKRKKQQKKSVIKPKSKAKKRVIGKLAARKILKIKEEMQEGKKRTKRRLLDDFAVIKDDDQYKWVEEPMDEDDIDYSEEELEDEDNMKYTEEEEMDIDTYLSNYNEMEDEDYEYNEEGQKKIDDQEYEYDNAEQKKRDNVNPSPWRNKDLLTLATLNLDHYSNVKSPENLAQTERSRNAMGNVTTVKKNELRMKEIVHLLSTNNPDILVIQEIQDYGRFKDDFEKQIFTIAQERKDGVFVRGIDEFSPENPELINQYKVIEQPKWKAGNWSEKNAIIINTAVISGGDKMSRYGTALEAEGKNEQKLHNIIPDATLNFGKGERGRSYQPREPIVTELIYYAGTEKQRKIAVINVHTNPTGDSQGASMKEQNQDIIKALEACRASDRYDAVFAIGDFYMENADKTTFQQLINNNYKGKFGTPRTTFPTNNPNPHPQGYQMHHHRETDKGNFKIEKQKKIIIDPVREKNHKGQKADMLIHYTDEFFPEENVPNTYPPMFPTAFDAEEVRKIREARMGSDETDNKIVKVKDGKEEYERIEYNSKGIPETKKLSLKSEEVSAYRKPGPDHAFRLFRGYLRDKEINRDDSSFTDGHTIPRITRGAPIRWGALEARLNTAFKELRPMLEKMNNGKVAFIVRREIMGKKRKILSLLQYLFEPKNFTPLADNNSREKILGWAEELNDKSFYDEVYSTTKIKQEAPAIIEETTNDNKKNKRKR